MSLLKNFLFLRLVTITDGQLWILAVIWAGFVVLGLWSIFSAPRPLAAKIFWSLIIICLPIVGLLAYVLACLLTSEWELLQQMGFFSRSRKTIIESIQKTQN